MEKITTRKKRIVIIGVAILVAVLSILLAVFGLSKTSKIYEFCLNERDVAIEINDTVRLKVVSDDGKNQNRKVKVSWVSTSPSVATVGEDGTVVGIAGGETRITAVIKHGDREYSASCMVTVKSAELQYSTYKVRWFTQKQDRSSYDVIEESYERLIGSTAELTEKEIIKGLPANYSLNRDKSAISGTVQQKKGACVLEVYYDVAEITYSVDYYYESDKKLGTYDSKETKKYKAYAFSEVQVTDAPKTGFVINAKAKGMVAKNTSVVAGSKLRVYCDRIRSQVTITYVSGKKTATYENIYGVGLQKISDSTLTDSLAPYNVACYVNGELIAKPSEYVKTITADTKMEFKVKGVGFEYSTKENALVNVCEKSNTSSYTYLQGCGNTIYLSATYNTTGSKSNMFGITIRSGGTSREIRFQYQGVGVMKDNTSQGGTLSKVNPVYAYNTAGAGGNTYVWAQNTNGSNGMVKDSVVNKMLKYRWDASHDIIWAIWEGVLYCNVDGETAIRLPLDLLHNSWTADTKFEIGFSTFDGLGSDDELKISDVTVAFNEKAEAKLVTDGQMKYAEKSRMDYEPITGSYMSASSAGAAYIYSEPSAENIGISTEIEWVNKDNTNSAAGVTIQVGEESVQYIIEGMNTQLRHQTDHAWKQTEIKWVTAQVKKLITPFEKDGTSDVQAFVKDGYFYITYNGVQAHCINLLSLFPEYRKDTEVSIGLYTWDANNGLARFKNTKVLTKKEVQKIDSLKWPYYSESMTIDANDFAKGTLEKTSIGNKNVSLLGENSTWYVKGSMDRSTSMNDGGLMIGFKITSGEKIIRVLGTWNGFAYDIGNGFVYTPYNEGRTVYSFNDKADGFFGGTKDTLPFEAAIYNDVLYVWLDGEICWRVPLTETTFGGFAEGSVYNLSLHLEADDVKASMKLGDVKMGHQVSEQKEFVDTIALIDSNITRWDDFTNKRLTGKTADELTTITKNGQGAVAYLRNSSDNIYLSAVYNTIPSTNSTHKETTFNFGLTMKQGDTSRQIIFRKLSDNTAVVRMMKSENWNAGEPVMLSDAVVSRNKLTKMLFDKDGGAYKIEWAITEGYLYGSIDGSIFLKTPMKALCERWTPENKDGYQVGFFQWATDAAGDVKFTDIEALYGEDAVKKLYVGENDKRISDVEFSNMYYEVLGGTYVPFETTGASYLYSNSAVSNSTQAMKATITLENADSLSAYSGITIKDVNTGKTAQILANSTKTMIQLNYNGNSMFDVTSMLQNGAKAFTDGKGEVTAVVKDGKMYLFYDDKQAVAVSLKDILSGYTNGNEIQLGISTWNANGGIARFAEVQYLDATSAGAINISDENIWKFRFLTSSVTNAEVDYENGTIKKAADGAVGVKFLESSDVWEVSGTMKRNKKSEALHMGFMITDSNGKTMHILGNYAGFRRIINNDWANVITFSNNCYSFNNTSVKFFSVAQNDNNSSEISFKAVVKDDVFYVWFDDQLCWRVPLNDSEFGSNLANGQYELSLNMPGDTPGMGSFENISVKHEISGNIDFGVLDENITKWATFTNKQLVGSMAEEVDSIALTGDKTTAYLKQTSDKIYLSAAYNTRPNSSKLTFNYGITIKQGNVSRQIVIRQHTDGNAVIRMFTGETYGSGPQMLSNADINRTPISNMMKDSDGGAYKMEWIITDGKLFGYLDGTRFLAVSLSSLYSGWTTSNTTGYQIGFFQWATSAAGDVKFTNIQAVFGEGASAKIQQIIK